MWRRRKSNFTGRRLCWGQPLIAPTTFGGRQYEGEPQGMLLPRTVIPRGGISVTEDED